jgi:hypothetical protein
MKKITILLITITSLFSCNNKEKTKFIETSISELYKIELPDNFLKIKEGIWEVPNTTLNILSINIKNETRRSLQREIDNQVDLTQNDFYFKDMVFVNSEKFENKDFKGLISYFEKDNEGKGLGLVTLKSYITIGVIQDEVSNIHFTSINLSKSINDEITQSIKSISQRKVIVKNKNFDEEKAKNDGYQIFKDENFIIKCKGKILFDKARFENDQQSGQPNYSKPYHVFKNGVDYNINVSDMSSLLIGKNSNDIAKYNDENLVYYQTKFDEMGVKNKQKKFKNFNAVFYEISQNDKSTKAVYFHNNMKSYMLQVSSSKNSQKLFDEFIDTFESIKK